MARVSTALTLLVLALCAPLSFVPRDGGAELRPSFAASGVDPIPTGATGSAAAAEHARDTFAP